jgi:glycosyltransferase involved in cell wall biosynthesis
VDIAHFKQRPDAAQARQQLGLPAEVPLGGMVARLTEGNGVLEAVKILERLPNDWHLVLVGDGPLRPAVEDQARRANLAHRLHFTGVLSDVRPAYAALDVVLFLARYQPFCLMLAEAMLSRVPIVGLQGAGEYTESAYPLITRENARLILRQSPWEWESVEPSESYDKVASAMVEVSSRSPAVLSQLDAAERWVATRFTAEQQAFHTMQAYTSLLGTVPRS